MNRWVHFFTMRDKLSRIHSATSSHDNATTDRLSKELVEEYGWSLDELKKIVDEVERQVDRLVSNRQ